MPHASSPVETHLLGASEADLARASAIVRAGGLVAFPTETVYGLGADATNPRAVARIYAAKGRPHFNPLIAHVASREEAFALGQFNAEARALAETFWPGPLTLVVPVEPDCPVSELARAGLPSLALRVPSHPVALRLIAAAGCPIVAPSANRSGHVSPTDAAHVAADLDGRIEAIVDGGRAMIGVESTILACLENEVILLRAGGISRAQIARIIGREPADMPSHSENNPLAPGRLASHYAPKARLRLNATHVEADEACLGFGPVWPQGSDETRRLSLSLTGDLVEAAANLYHHLRALDAAGYARICVAPIPAEGLGEAIADRLARAAAPRIP